MAGLGDKVYFSSGSASSPVHYTSDTFGYSVGDLYRDTEGFHTLPRAYNIAFLKRALTVMRKFEYENGPSSVFENWKHAAEYEIEQFEMREKEQIIQKERLAAYADRIVSSQVNLGSYATTTTDSVHTSAMPVVKWTYDPGVWDGAKKKVDRRAQALRKMWLRKKK